MARRVFLHVGTPKTGTTYLQSLLWANQERRLPSTGSCYRSAMLATTSTLHGRPTVQTSRGGELCATSAAVTGDLDEHIPAPQPSDAQVPADVDIQAVAEVAVESIASLLFETDNLATQRLIDDQCRLAAELEQRTLG